MTKDTKIGAFHGRLSKEDHVDGPTANALRFINKKDAKGLTPFQIALSHKNQHIKNALILIGSGANIDVM